MSLLLGSRSERLPLDVAVDQLVAAARWAGAPSLLWLAGVLYPELIDAWSVVEQGLRALAGGAGLDLGFLRAFGTEGGPFQPVRVIGTAGGKLALFLSALPVALVAARLSAGLARVAVEERRGSLRNAWDAGRGHTWSAFWLWLLLAGLLLGALVVLVLPLLGVIEGFELGAWSPVLALLLTPALLVVLVYAALLQIVQQLALHSLVQNERGVSSALTHGWRLVCNAPWSAVRAASCDLLLILMSVAAATLGRALSGVSELLTVFVVLGCAGYLGTVRAAFWGRVYRALGGQVSGDPLHGLGD